jgi:nicotinamidase/pyrazinamidase
MGRKILIIVDGQYDFLEGGALAVEGGRDAMTNLTEFIEKHYKEYDGIFLTADWHPITHCSFKDNGGIWPTHCVQFSHGAAIYQPILDVLDDLKVDYDVLTKGCDEDHEEYSIFKNVTSEAYLKGMNKYNEIGVVDICGIAGDYCVLDTIKDGLMAFPSAEFHVIKECVASIDGGATLNKFIDENERVVCHE